MNHVMSVVRATIAVAGLVGLAACGVDQKKIDAAQPATGEDLVAYSQDITKGVKLDRDAKLLQFFCHNTTGGPCPADIAAKLKAYGFEGEASGVDLAYAFANMAADVEDGNNDQQSTDIVYLRAIYRVALNRPPEDEQGGNYVFLVDGGERKALLRSLLQSEELRSR